MVTIYRLENKGGGGGRGEKKEGRKEKENTPTLDVLSRSSPTQRLVKFKVRVRFRCSYRVPRYHVLS